MAGRKQHYIPQLLQRGFGFKKGNSTQVYVFKKGRIPYSSSIVGVAAQRDFYSKPGEGTLDDKITIYESKVLAPAIQALRSVNAGPVDSRIAAAVVSHLSIRSEFMRGSFSSVVTDIINYFIDGVGACQTARAFLELDTLSSESVLMNSIGAEMSKNLSAISDSGRESISKLVYFRIREKFPEMYPEIAAEFLRQLAILLEKIPDIVVNSHNNELEASLVASLPLERLRMMKWRMIAAESPIHFFLPDCLALGARRLDFQDMEPYPLVGAKDLVGVVMPICSDRVLVGSIGNVDIDVAMLNKSFARCSLNFFVSSKNDESAVKASELIGSTVSRLVDNLVHERAFFASDQINNGELPKTEECVQERTEFLVEFEPSIRESAKVRAALRDLLSAPELQFGLRAVRSIIVTTDISRSLRKRGVTLNEYADQFVSCGFCHMTETQFGVSCQIFLTASSVDMALKRHPLSRAAAATICHQAGRATYYAIVAAKVSRKEWHRQRPLLDMLELQIAHFVCSQYFGGRLCGIKSFSEKDFIAADGLFIRVLDKCMNGISAARLQFISHRDVNAALSLAFVQVEQLLNAAASACATGALDFLDYWKRSESVALLRTVGLGDWFELFALDLQRIFDSRDVLSGDGELVMLGSHVRRVLWSFGVIVSSQTPGQVFMEVLSEKQLENIRKVLRA